jgi:hypothetical protein
VACCPAFLLVPGRYVHQFLYERSHMSEGQLFVDLGELPWIWIPLRALRDEGLLGALLCAAPLGLLLRPRPAATAALAVPALAGVALVGSWRYTSLHYLLWALPAAAVLAARLLDAIPRSAGGRLAHTAVVLGVVAANSVPNALRSARWVLEDSNALAAERWTESHVPAGERLRHDWYSLPTLWSETQRDEWTARLAKLPAGAKSPLLPLVRAKPVYTGPLGYIIDPPSAEGLRAERPVWVVTSSKTEPASPEPLPGYGGTALATLHRRLAGFYGELRDSGDYRVEREFSAGPGPTFRLHRRVRD